MNAFAPGECDFDIVDAHDLIAPAHEMHLDASQRRIIERLVAELIEPEIGPHFPIDSSQQVQVERGGHALDTLVRLCTLNDCPNANAVCIYRNRLKAKLTRRIYTIQARDAA